MKDYQLNYAADRPSLYDKKTREGRAFRMIKTLADFYGVIKLKDLKVLDIGSSTGIIDNVLSYKFKQVTGTDIDEQAIKFASKNFNHKNLRFKVEDAMNLSFPANSFDVVICAQVYEHVPDPKKLFSEIYRVLKPDGVCYLAALNKLWPIEPHYNLPFLAWLPKKIANLYIQITGKASSYYETPKSYWQLRNLTRKFTLIDYTPKILRNPNKFGYNDTLPNNLMARSITWIFSPLSRILAPTFFWILIK